MPPIQDNDLFVLYRDDGTLRKVTIDEMKEVFGGAITGYDGGFSPQNQTLNLDGGFSDG